MKFRSWWLPAGYLVMLLFLSLTAARMTGFSSVEQNPDLILLSPSWQHWFGTDSLGRDLFVRVMTGALNTLGMALGASFMTMILGIVIGGWAGWQGGWIDRVLRMGMDVFQSMPSFLSVSLLCLALQTQFSIPVALIWSIALVHWFNVAKVTRGLTRQIRTFSYIDSARALGAGSLRIFMRHILPNMSSTLWVLFGMQIPASILYESMVSFAGFGIQAPDVSWGLLIQEGWRSLSQFPHLLLLPAGVLFGAVFSFHILIQSLLRHQQALRNESTQL